MEENKQEICDSLLKTLQKTRHLSDLYSLIYTGKMTSGNEYVVATFRTGNRKAINVTADSGIAMIKDIVKWLE